MLAEGPLSLEGWDSSSWCFCQGLCIYQASFKIFLPMKCLEGSLSDFLAQLKVSLGVISCSHSSPFRQDFSCILQTASVMTLIFPTSPHPHSTFLEVSKLVSGFHYWGGLGGSEIFSKTVCEHPLIHQHHKKEVFFFSIRC